jgi:acyl-coenzyme A synthetase/AMP-(fatty) acid ligase
MVCNQVTAMQTVNPLFKFFLQQAAGSGSKPCVVTTGHTLYYQDVLNSIDYFTTLCGIQPGSTIVLNIDKPLLLYLLAWTGIANNCSLVLLPAVTEPALLRQYVKEIPAAVTITDIKDHNGEDAVCFIDTLPAFELLPAAASNTYAAVTEDLLEGKEIFFFTSGTTSAAKLTATGYHQLLLALKCISAENLMPYTAGQTVFITPPLYHSYGFSAMMEYGSNGSTIVLPEEKAISAYVKTIASRQLPAAITAIEGVPYYHEQLKLIIKKCRLEQLLHIGFGGDAVPIALMEFYRTYLPGLSFSIRYGLTEIPSVISLLFVSPGQPLQSNGGKLLPFIKTVIATIAETGSDEGEISAGYDAAAAEKYGISQLPQQLISTGDTGYEQEGCLVITGRKKHLGKVNGFTVNTQVLENTLRKHNNVQDSCVVLEKNELRVQVVAAGITEQQVRQYIQAALPAYYQPASLLLVSSIARTETGKIIRHNVQQK